MGETMHPGPSSLAGDSDGRGTRLEFREHFAAEEAQRRSSLKAAPEMVTSPPGHRVLSAGNAAAGRHPGRDGAQTAAATTLATRTSGRETTAPSEVAIVRVFRLPWWRGREVW